MPILRILDPYQETAMGTTALLPSTPRNWFMPGVRRILTPAQRAKLLLSTLPRGAAAIRLAAPKGIDPLSTLQSSVSSTYRHVGRPYLFGTHEHRDNATIGRDGVRWESNTVREGRL